MPESSVPQNGVQNLLTHRGINWFHITIGIVVGVLLVIFALAWYINSNLEPYNKGPFTIPKQTATSSAN